MTSLLLRPKKMYKTIYIPKQPWTAISVSCDISTLYLYLYLTFNCYLSKKLNWFPLFPSRKESTKRCIPKNSTRQKKKKNIPVFAVTYDIRLLSITKIQAKRLRSMVNRNPYLAEVFPSPPLTALRRQPNLRNHLIRAKVVKSQNSYPKRYKRGMAKVNRLQGKIFK